MKQNISSYLNVFTHLMRGKMQLLQASFAERVINMYIWAGCTILIAGYLLQSFGLAGNFGAFQLAGILATAGLFEAFGNIATLVMDFTGDQSINFYLTLPVPAWVIFAHLVCIYAITGIAISLVIIPLGKLMLFNTFGLTLVSWTRLGIILLLANIFFATLIVYLTSKTETLSGMRNVWTRFIFPLWFLGGFQFSWAALHKTIPVLSYFTLANPIMYAMEGTRAALLGQHDYLPFWICCAALIVFSTLCWWRGYVNLKRQLDFV